MVRNAFDPGRFSRLRSRDFVKIKRLRTHNVNNCTCAISISLKRSGGEIRRVKPRELSRLSDYWPGKANAAFLNGKFLATEWRKFVIPNRRKIASTLSRMQSVIRRLQRGNSIEIPAATTPLYLPGKSVSPRCSLLDKGDGREKKRGSLLLFPRSTKRITYKHAASQCIVTLTPETAARSDPPFVPAHRDLSPLLLRSG